MTSEGFLELLEQIDDCYVEEAAPVTKKSKRIWIAVLAAAACVALAIAVSLTVRSLRVPANDSHIEDNPPADTSGQIDIAVPTGATDGTETPSPTLEFVPQYGAFGDGAKTVALSDAEIKRLKEHEDLASIALYPTLLDLHPADQSGLLVEVTPEERAREIAVGQDFLAYYYDADPIDFDFKAAEELAGHVVWYKNDEIDGGVNLDWIQFQLCKPYEGEMSAAEIAAQPIVRAALEWKGIQTPEIRETVGLNAKGAPSEFIFSFYERSDDPVEQALNASFRAVTVTIYAEERLFSIVIDYGEPIINEGNTSAVTPEQLNASLANAYPGNPPRDYVTEIIYSYHVEPGKIIPCYRIYLLESDLPRVAGRIVYSVIEVTTAEITAVE